jgi:hypothetical protein
MRVCFNVTLFALAMCLGAADGQTTSPGVTGVEGTVMVSPVRPGPIRKGSESPKAPLSNAAFSVTSDNGEVTKFTTDVMGRFKILLKPGHYVVSLAENRFPKPCGPFEIRIESGKITQVEWRCDSGMR